MKLGIIGCTGRLATEIINLINKSNDYELTAAIAREGNARVGEKILCNNNSVEITTDLDDCSTCDVLIDVATRDSCLNNLKKYKQLKKPLIIGTTGFSSEEILSIEKTAELFPICMSSNFSEELIFFIEAVKAYSKLTNIVDANIMEYHHVNKKDIPSGTALMIKDAILQANKNISVYIHSVRAGNIKGEHTVLFTNTFGEEIIFTHKASDRSVFAQGILKTALKLTNLKNGIYSFKDILLNN
ncbi:dihydrodipicolinate reductase [Treponema bryantii]|uniref:4-hydroxy-tetrahydrodipicolinate reductase n=1 Tax=Treponema bryantii TaxID=163 RepID=A0A1I3MI18_9SPIR|nr:dihydrodipicolinate reductase C-terminal domain-containing protein [Treponema bryantii]SFI96365.1 dihydrodipicolinate reductase [Treponema bryantii]